MQNYLLAESSNQRILLWDVGTETGERDLGSSEPRRVLEKAYSFPSPGTGFGSGSQGGKGLL